MKEFLVVHGYEVYKGGKPGTLAEAVCRKVAKIEKNYKYIIMLGGWHLKELNPSITIGRAMALRLKSLGVSLMKVHALGLKDRFTIMPARDSMEEVDLLPTLFRQLTVIPPRKIQFDAICFWCFAPRVRFLYKNRGANCEKIIKAFSWKTLLNPIRVLLQVPAYFLTRKDPLGKSAAITNNRAKRTLFRHKYLTNFNYPERWN